MMHEQQLCEWLTADPLRMRALQMACDLGLPDWCIAAGFVRNLVWDKLHRFDLPTALADIDLIYFDPLDCSAERDKDLEQFLITIDPSLPWSVHNQARMHKRNQDPPYHSTLDAMAYWVEQETAVGARQNEAGQLEILSAFGLDSLFGKKITPNKQRHKPAAFAQRLAKKNWLWIWPELYVDA